MKKKDGSLGYENIKKENMDPQSMKILRQDSFSEYENSEKD